jgi:uncharacterized membrane protein YecN with MAPEG domain
MPITALYAGVLAPIYVLLAVRVIATRRRAKIALGDGGVPAMLRCMRVQANFAEYVPFALVLMALAESLGTPSFGLHLGGIVLVAGRALHAYGVSQEREVFTFRVAGMALTFTTILGLGAACLVGSIVRSVG